MEFRVIDLRDDHGFSAVLQTQPEHSGNEIKNHPGQQISQLHKQPHFERFAGKINEQRPRKAAGSQRLALNPQPRMVRYSELGEADQEVSAGAIHPRNKVRVGHPLVLNVERVLAYTTIKFSIGIKSEYIKVQLV